MELKLIEEKDVELLEKWLQKPYIFKYFYHPDGWITEVKERHNKFSFITHYMVIEDKKPIGFCQFYDYSLGGELWEGSFKVNKTASIDYLIGEEEYLGKGYASKIINLLVDKIRETGLYKSIIVKPDVENETSRRSLISSGFNYDLKNDLFYKYLFNFKSLKELSLVQLWNLFPIFLVPYNPKWEVLYEEIKDELSKLLITFKPLSINHIGSTAIKDIYSKNIIDILVEFKLGTDLGKVASYLEKHNFILMSLSNERACLNRGYGINGFEGQAYHIHLRFEGDNKEIAFRDYLNSHDLIAKKYEILKLRLSKKYMNNRDRYTSAKTRFVNKYTKRALKSR